MFQTFQSVVGDVGMNLVMFYVAGADGDVNLCLLVGTPVPKGLSNSSDNVIVERTPTLVRKVTVLKQLPEHRPVPSCERSIVVKSTKLLPIMALTILIHLETPLGAKNLPRNSF